MCIYVYMYMCVCVCVCVGMCILVFMKQAQVFQHLPQLSRFVAFVAFSIGICLQIERANKWMSPSKILTQIKFSLVFETVQSSLRGSVCL